MGELLERMGIFVLHSVIPKYPVISCLTSCLARLSDACYMHLQEVQNMRATLNKFDWEASEREELRAADEREKYHED